MIIKRRVDELDGLRGLLATWVAVSHMFCWTGFCDRTTSPLFSNFFSGFFYAQPAVQTFIILSGFAIAFLLEKQKESYWPFMRGRFFRIYPTYLVCLALGVATSYLFPFILNQAGWRETPYLQQVDASFTWQNRHLLANLLSHLTLLNGLFPRSVLPMASTSFLPPAWSITLEWQFYLVAPAIALFIRSGAGLLFLGAVAYAGILLEVHWTNPALAFLPPYLPLFLVGMGTCYFFNYLNTKSSEESSKLATPVAIVFIACVLFSQYSFALGTWGLVWCCILADGQSICGRFFLRLRGLLLSRWLQLLGSMSYPVYLIHWSMITILMSLILWWKPSITPLEAVAYLFALGMPTIFISAWVLHKYVEEPFHNLGKKYKRQTAVEISKAPKAPLDQTF
jgi:peptidoglycan/LPS O-acetylase OafA/YrhL